MPHNNTISLRTDSFRHYPSVDLLNNEQSIFKNKPQFRLIQNDCNQKTYSPLGAMNTFTVKPMTPSSSNSVKNHTFLWARGHYAHSLLTPTPVKKTLHQPILSLLDAVIDGQQAIIHRLARLPQAPYNEVTLRQQLKEKLIEHSNQELLKANSVFSKQNLQGIVNQLSEQGLQFLHEQEKNSQPYSSGFSYGNSYYPHHQRLQEKHCSRQNQQGHLNQECPENRAYKNSTERLLSYSQLEKNSISACEKFNNIHSPNNKKYQDFYQGHLFNPRETIINPVRVYEHSENLELTRKKILRSGYNCFNDNQIHPIGEYNFFHQAQNGPYCQTVSVNNFLGDNLVTPDILHQKLNFQTNNIGKELTTCRTLELFSLIRIEQRKSLQSLLEISENTVVTSSFKKEIEKSQHLLKELNCRACDIDSGNQQQVEKFIRAAEKSGINRLHLTFPCTPKVMHAIALRRDPSDPQLWIVLDGNLPTHRLSLRDALRGYSQRGSIRLVTRKDLFKADRSIACCQIKRKPEGGVILTEPTTEQLSQWRNVSRQVFEKMRLSNPNQLDCALYYWKKENPTAYRRCQSQPVTSPSYRFSLF